MKFQIVVMGAEFVEGAVVVIIDLIIDVASVDVAGFGLGYPVSVGTSLGSVFTEGEDWGSGSGCLGPLVGLDGHHASNKVEFNGDKGSLKK